MEYTNSAGKKVTLTLLDIEERLYDLSFDPNHPPELRWGAPEGSEERASAPETFTPVPGGARVAMEDGYRWQAFYRSLGQRETELSCLRGMFTSGYPIRDKLDAQVGKWIQEPEPAPEEPARLADTAEEPEAAATGLAETGSLSAETQAQAPDGGTLPRLSDDSGREGAWTFTEAAHESGSSVKKREPEAARRRYPRRH
jgi:hypothetical protein